MGSNPTLLKIGFFLMENYLVDSRQVSFALGTAKGVRSKIKLFATGVSYT